MFVPAVVLPLGALVVAFFAVAVPVILLVTVWAVVTAFRLLIPERPPAFTAVRRRPPAARGEAAVRLRDIVEHQARQPAAPLTSTDGPGTDRHPLFDDLWLRRN